MRAIPPTLHIFKLFLISAEGLVGGEAFGVDASLIKADANREDGIAPEDCSPADHASRATAEYLQTRDDAAFGAAMPVEPKFISPIDLAARWSAARGRNRGIQTSNLARQCYSQAWTVRVFNFLQDGVPVG